MTLGFEPFQWAARQLGVRMEPAESKLLSDRIVLDGTVNGIRVHIVQTKGEIVWVDFAAYLDPPADLRLSVRPAGLASKLGVLLGRHDIEVGEKEFDSAFDIKADEPARAKAFLTPGLREALLTWKKTGAEFWITDEEVHLWTRPGAWSTHSGETIVADARAVAALARTASDALHAVPASTQFAAHVDAWRGYATTHGFAFSASPLRVIGALSGASFVARAVAVSNHDWGVELRLQFTQQLPWFVRVRPSRLFDFLERTGNAVHLATGDAAFDHEFRVTTADAEKTKAFVDADVRSALMELHRDQGGVVLDSDGVSVRTNAMTDPASFGGIVDRVAAVARKLNERAAPYRTGE
jgi:hypothetical protein